jgi:hypothetical protein
MNCTLASSKVHNVCCDILYIQFALVAGGNLPHRHLMPQLTSRCRPLYQTVCRDDRPVLLWRPNVSEKPTNVIMRHTPAGSTCVQVGTTRNRRMTRHLSCARSQWCSAQSALTARHFKSSFNFYPSAVLFFADRSHPKFLNPNISAFLFFVLALRLF